MSFKEYIEEKCKNCTKECQKKIVQKIDGTVECIKDEGLYNNK